MIFGEVGKVILVKAIKQILTHDCITLCTVRISSNAIILVESKKATVVG